MDSGHQHSFPELPTGEEYSYNIVSIALNIGNGYVDISLLLGAIGAVAQCFDDNLSRGTGIFLASPSIHQGRKISHRALAGEIPG